MITVNADDFGKNSKVNKAILEGFQKGILDTTTVMVNMPAAKEAYEISKEYGFSDKVGLHINLTEGFPLTEDIKKIPYFCDRDGRFNAAFYYDTLKRLVLPAKAKKAVKAEIKAQLLKYGELGFDKYHIDSHHHVHTNLPVLKALEALKSEFSYSYIRLSRNLYKGGNKPNKLYKSFYNSKVRKICKRTTDYFGSFEDLIAFLDIKMGDEILVLEAAKDFIKTNDVEIMVHPDYENNELMDDKISLFDELKIYEILKKN